MKEGPWDNRHRVSWSIASVYVTFPGIHTTTNPITSFRIGRNTPPKSALCFVIGVLFGIILSSCTYNLLAQCSQISWFQSRFLFYRLEFPAAEYSSNVCGRSLDVSYASDELYQSNSIRLPLFQDDHVYQGNHSKSPRRTILGNTTLFNSLCSICRLLLGSICRLLKRSCGYTGCLPRRGLRLSFVVSRKTHQLWRRCGAWRFLVPVEWNSSGSSMVPQNVSSCCGLQ